MKRICGICGGEPNGDDHHIIPKFFYLMLNLSDNPDDFRIVLCSEHHKLINQRWDKIRYILKKRLKE